MNYIWLWLKQARSIVQQKRRNCVGKFAVLRWITVTSSAQPYFSENKEAISWRCLQNKLILTEPDDQIHQILSTVIRKWPKALLVAP